MPRIRFSKKLALVMNGLDVSLMKVGDIVETDKERAEAMIISDWAENAPGNRKLAKPLLSSLSDGPSEIDTQIGGRH